MILGGNTKVANPHANFQNSFAGTTGNGYGLSNALVKVNFAYYGYTNAFNVVNEVKVGLSVSYRALWIRLISYQNPIKVLKRTGPASLLVVAILYLLCNIAYFAASEYHKSLSTIYLTDLSSKSRLASIKATSCFLILCGSFWCKELIKSPQLF